MRFARDYDAIAKWTKQNGIPNPEFLIEIVVKYDAHIYAKLLDAPGKTISGVQLLFLVDFGVYVQVAEDRESFLEYAKDVKVQVIPEQAINRVREPINKRVRELRASSRKVTPTIAKTKTRGAIKKETLNNWLASHPPVCEKTYWSYHKYYRMCSTDHVAGCTFVRHAKKMYPSIELMSQLISI